MPAITIEQLPPPPQGLTGFPWTAASPALPPTLPCGRAWPKVSIVTPSFNQSQYLEETIRSVLLQGYPDIEYIVMDGGSRDSSVRIIEKYQSFLAYWTSGPDAGQAAAIRAGFERSTGLWAGWQNSDDVYAPGAIATAVRAASDDVSVLYGSVLLTDAASKVTGAARTSDFSLLSMFPWANMFNQSMLFHRRVFDAGLTLDRKMLHYLDHEFFWRLILAGMKFQYVPEFSACFRIHDQAKGNTQQEIAANELQALYKRIYNEPRLPQDVRDKALESMRGLCVDQFGKSRWELFDRFTSELKSLAGLRGLGAGLCLRRIACCLGPRRLERVKRLFGRGNPHAA